MCLYEVNFALKYNSRGKYFYGEGWKAYEKDCCGSLMAYQCKLVPKIKRWTIADKDYFEYPIESDKAIKRVDGYSDYKKYIPGFHVWLNKEDAENYFNPLYKNNWVTVPVLFRDVIAFGTNVTFGDSPDRYKPCVIAKEIKVNSYEVNA